VLIDLFVQMDYRQLVVKPSQMDSLLRQRQKMVLTFLDRGQALLMVHRKDLASVQMFLRIPALKAGRRPVEKHQKDSASLLELTAGQSQALAA
jgi:hypothetical protein